MAKFVVGVDASPGERKAAAPARVAGLEVNP